MKAQIKEYMINKFGHFPQDLDQLTEFIKGFNSHTPQSDDVEIIYLEDDIDSMSYKQYNKDGDCIMAGNIQYPSKQALNKKG